MDLALGDNNDLVNIFRSGGEGREKRSGAVKKLRMRPLCHRRTLNGNNLNSFVCAVGGSAVLGKMKRSSGPPCALMVPVEFSVAYCHIATRSCTANLQF